MASTMTAMSATTRSSTASFGRVELQRLHEVALHLLSVLAPEQVAARETASHVVRPFLVEEFEQAGDVVAPPRFVGSRSFVLRSGQHVAQEPVECAVNEVS